MIYHWKSINSERKKSNSFINDKCYTMIQFVHFHFSPHPFKECQTEYCKIVDRLLIHSLNEFYRLYTYLQKAWIITKLSQSDSDLKQFQPIFLPKMNKIIWNSAITTHIFAYFVHFSLPRLRRRLLWDKGIQLPIWLIVFLPKTVEIQNWKEILNSLWLP